ncbi:hypothetical protein TIN4_65 [Tsukamurella phage TIN4]|uniref:Uncharacterized protein n=2 Tax=Tinduovirus TIN3 TaxID=1982571 RepID=A0A0K0N5U4_9CAUD|nr:hypothetical protein AVT54_gp060 [Tsukamurella phage TIN3]YP_009604195.1 hypothetical protein FDH87_gp060 [Tsukamurella phage TIN4]AKJ71862.1 hypothetical protein TIN3_65 [Tsukamurella phage TIN3]AKJ71971.1 hypothetical protein TIN4_65 [Tsukamurella phage TIN4]
MTSRRKKRSSGQSESREAPASGRPDWIKDTAISGTKIHEQLEQLTKDDLRKSLTRAVKATVQPGEMIVSGGGARGLMQQVPGTFAGIAGGSGGKGGQMKTQPYTGLFGPLHTKASSQEEAESDSLKLLRPLSPVGYRTVSAQKGVRMDSMIQKQGEWISKMTAPPLIELGRHNRWREPAAAWELIDSYDLYDELLGLCSTHDEPPRGWDVELASGFRARITTKANPQANGLYVLLDSDVDNSYGKVPVFRPFVNTNGARPHAEWKIMQETLFAVLIHTEAYFEFPLLAEIDDANNKIANIWYARMRAEVDEDAQTVKIVGLVEATITVNNKSENGLFVVNIGEFPWSYQIPLEVIEQAFVSSVDEIVDLGAGADIFCRDCEKAYSILDPLTVDRMCLALTGKCIECEQHKFNPKDFGDAVPPPPF